VRARYVFSNSLTRASLASSPQPGQLVETHDDTPSIIGCTIQPEHHCTHSSSSAVSVTLTSSCFDDINYFLS
jgi:hypothetical protein